jgi:hypothetical protein
MIRLPLTFGKFAVIDDWAWDVVQSYTWYYTNPSGFRRKHGGYAHTVILPQRQSLMLHRLIIGAKPGDMVDHVNRDKLDNRLENLRFCNVGLNNANKPSRTSKTGFRGVELDGAVYCAYISVNRRKVRLGRFKTAPEAAQAYDEAARFWYGPHAITNFQ